MRNYREGNCREVITPWSGSYIEFKPAPKVPPTTEYVKQDQSVDYALMHVVFWFGALFGGALIYLAGL